MPYFTQKNGVMFAEDIPLTDIAAQYGTPAYVYSKAELEEQIDAYINALSNRAHMVCYAVKANSNIAVLNILANRGAGFDIVSLGELERVLAAGGKPEKIVFSGVGKTASEMARALDVGIHCFNVESEAELLVLNSVAQNKGVTANISLRVNPDVDANTHPYISTGLKENKFGIDINKALEAYSAAQQLSNLNIVGVDCHIGSQITEIEPFIDALVRVLLLVDQLAEENIHLQHIDLGGGLGVRYQDEEPPAIADYIQAIDEKLGDRPLSLILEPGRSITANAGILLTEVLYLKETPDRNFAIVDAAMNDMIRPSLYNAWLNIDPVISTETPSKTYDIVGPICETGDFLGKQRELAIEQGDLLCIGSSGAYGFTMSSNYNSRGRAPEIIVDGHQHHLVRKRETTSDLIALEQLIPSS